MIFDTDVLIWFERGHPDAARLINDADTRYVSVFSCMEFFQGARNRQHLATLQDFLTSMDFVILPLTESIGHRALIYIEEYSLTHGLSAADALVAATAAENNLTLVSSNAKHFRAIKDLSFNRFTP